MTKPIRDRILEFRRVPASELLPNPRNWRTHGEAQRAALAGLLAEVGYAGALLARRRDDGKLELIDGHLRAATTPDQTVPVLILDVSESEADKLLATFDPLTGMAGVNPKRLRALLKRVDSGDPAIRGVLKKLEVDVERSDGGSSPNSAELEFDTTFQVLVECRSEREQQDVYEQLTSAGLPCRLLML